MRMWGVDPKILCQKHLCGEHLEMHMFVGTINKGISIKGYLDNKLVNPKLIKKRHNMLASEMINRGFNHKSLLPKVKGKLINNELDIKYNKKDLFGRCKQCLKRSKEIRVN